MVLDWGVHLFDQIFRLTGERRLKTVYATLTNVTNQEVDDGFTAVLRFEGGLEVLVEVGTNNLFLCPAGTFWEKTEVPLLRTGTCPERL